MRKTKRKTRWSRIGKLISGIGILFVLCAIALWGYNRWDDLRAENAAAKAAEQLDNYRDEQDFPDVDIDAENEIDPETEMKEVIIDGIAYIGNLQVPSLGLNLPVISKWSYDYLKIAPCRYTGSVYSKDMVIAAHNYRRHFGAIRSLEKGTRIIFIDMNNKEFVYEIEENEILQPTQVEKMTESDYDLTLFTCVYDGTARQAIRCNEVTND